jgi:hypothetical protein
VAVAAPAVQLADLHQLERRERAIEELAGEPVNAG